MVGRCTSRGIEVDIDIALRPDLLKIRRRMPGRNVVCVRSEKTPRFKTFTDH